MSTDLVIVGAGPAGVSAALWARSQGLSATLLEAADAPGGRLHHVHFEPREMPGPSPGTGPELAAAYRDQLDAAGVDVRYRHTAAGLEWEDGVVGVAISGGRRVHGRAVLVATGTRRRRLEAPGDRELEGRGVTYSATRDRERLKGRRVAVVGGGDGAYENALNLAADGSEVVIVVRGRPRARGEFRRRVASDPRIRVLEGTRITRIVGTLEVGAVAVEGPDGPREVAVDAVVVKIGEVPNTEWCGGALELDEDGYVVVDPAQRTGRTGVWAAGDVTRPKLPAIAVAYGAAALAVADIRSALNPE